MVQYYTIFGQKVASHVLAMVSLGTTFGGAYLAMSGGKKPDQKAKGPPINAGSEDEEKFINEFITKQEASNKQ